MDMVDKFKILNKKYDDLFKYDLENGNLPMRTTEFGFWGTASLFTVFEFFQKIELHKYKKFLDLGSGDGRIVLLASLFTEAVGIEGDEELVKKSNEIKEELGFEGTFLAEDYFKHDFTQYDFIFIYPDKGFSPEFEEKLNNEVKGAFYVYNELYRPYGMKKGPTTWIDQMPVTIYEPKKPENSEKEENTEHSEQ